MATTVVDHQALKAIAASLRQMAIETPDELPRHRVLQTLQDFRNLLQAHFAYEEEEGYVPHIAVQRPGLSSWAQRLAGEHPALLAEIDQILAGAQKDDIAKVCGRAKAFLDRLASHEEAEFHLASEALLPDGLW